MKVSNWYSHCFFQIAGKVAAPLSKTNEIVILSGEGSRVTGEVNRLLAELPVSVNALTGVDLTKVRRHCTVQSSLLNMKHSTELFFFLPLLSMKVITQTHLPYVYDVCSQ